MRPQREPNRDIRSGTPPSGPRGLVPAAYNEARKFYLQGRIPEALGRLESLFQPDGRGSQEDLRDAALLRAWCLIEKREHELCRRWLEKARLRGHLAADDIGATVIELNIQLFREQYAQVREEASALLAALDGPVTLERAELRLLLGAALRWEGNTREAVSHLEYAGSAFVVLEESGRAAVAANFLGWTLLSLGRLIEAAAWFEKSLEINTRLEAPLRRAQNFQNLAIVHYKRGRYPDARACLQQELELVADRPEMQCRARIALGNVERLQGDFLRARSNLLEAYTLAGANGMGREEVLALEFLGDVFRDEGSPAQAQRYYRRGLALARSLAPDGDLVMELLRRQGECLDLEGRHEEAHRVLNSALELCHRVGDEHETAVTLRCLGVNSSHLGCWTRSLLQLEQALVELKKLAAAQEAMIAGYHLARLLVRQLDTGNARHSRKQVLDRAWETALNAQQLNRSLDTPFLADELRELVNELARRRLLTGKTSQRTPAPARARTLSDRVVAASRSMQQVLRQCDGFATSDCAVLIQGECGSGKELLARRIHESSPRGRQTLVRISCATSDETLLARQLFGQAEPRPDDPRRVASGLVARAEGGTLLLSNIDELPRPLQAEIVHLLNDAKYRPLGDSREQDANVRVIATTSRELAPLVRDNLFRPDLHFKLRLMALQVPPLRSRPEDAMPLLDHFLTRLEGSPLTARELFDFSSLEEFATYDWPGGAAELEAIAQRAWLNRNLGRPVVLRQITGPAGRILEFAEDADVNRITAAGETPLRHSSGMTWTSLNSLIRKAGGNKARAARNLGVSRITLYRWLKQLKPQD